MRQQTLCALGFDHLGFALRPKTVDTPSYRIDFLSKTEFLGSGLEYDAIILPSGIFERHKIQPERDGERTIVESEKDLIEAMEKRLDGIWSRGGWVCVLVDHIIDRVNESNRATIVNDTDLAKKILNRFHIQRQPISGRNLTQCQVSEFSGYLKEYASAQTSFYPPTNLEVEKIFESSLGLVGFCVNENLFVLPHFRNYSKSLPVSEPIQHLVESILSRKTRSTSADSTGALPEWMSEFQFESEKKLLEERQNIEKSLQKIDEEWAARQKWKRILMAQASELEEAIRNIFEQYFALKLDRVAEPVNTPVWKIIGPSETALALLITASSEDELKRQHLNEADSIREKMGLNSNVPVLFVLNDHRCVQSFSGREQKLIPSEKVKHASSLRISVIRTTDLLLWMKESESWSPEKRKEDLLTKLQENLGLIRGVGNIKTLKSVQNS